MIRQPHIMSRDELPSWRETSAKQSIERFVGAVTNVDPADFVPEPERIAVSDNDGTLRTEQPMYARLAFALDRAAELGQPTSLDKLHAGDCRPLLPWSSSPMPVSPPMLQWAAASPHRTLQLVVGHTDGEREYAHDRDPILGSGTGKIIAAAAEHQWTLIDMAADWPAVFPPSL